MLDIWSGIKHSINNNTGDKIKMGILGEGGTLVCFGAKMWNKILKHFE